MNIPSVGFSVKRYVGVCTIVAGMLFSMHSGDALAATGSQTQWEPIGWRFCMNMTARYYDWIWEASTNPESGVNYDAIIADAKDDMDSACNQVLIENNLPTR